MDDAASAAGTVGAGCRVLVVDDNADSAQSMSLLLGLEGYQVECAYDGVEALERADEFQPDVVLLDLGLPRFSGYEVARRLRAAEDRARADPVLLVAVSGYGRERDRQAAREAGFDLHLTKPADPDVVLRVIADREALRAAGRQQAGVTATSRPDGAAGPPGRELRPDAHPSAPAPGPAAARALLPGEPVSGAARNA